MMILLGRLFVVLMLSLNIAQTAAFAITSTASGATARASKGTRWTHRWSQPPTLGRNTPLNHACLRAVMEGEGESTFQEPEADPSLIDSQVDLAKGIDFQAPKPVSKAEGEDGGNKQARVILYVALSLIPCLFLVPFLFSNEFIPVDPNQM
ncbi:unnamed protein product [Discosporangium mesarthrocarpum]